MTDVQVPAPETQPQEPTPSRIGSWIVLVAITLVFLIPFSFLIYSETSRHSAQQRANRSFIPVSAIVVESSVERGKVRWFAKITYRYRVDGQTYVSSRLSFAATSASILMRGGPSREEAAEIAADHPVGSAIDAFYDPTHPSDAVRDNSPPSGSPLTRISLLIVLVVLLSLLGVGSRDPGGRIAFPGPRIPESLISITLFLGCLAAYGAAAWFLVRAGRGSARSGPDDIGTAFAFGFIGSIIGWMWQHRRRTTL